MEKICPRKKCKGKLKTEGSTPTGTLYICQNCGKQAFQPESKDATKAQMRYAIEEIQYNNMFRKMYEEKTSEARRANQWNCTTTQVK